jgi:hypothetical protein
VTEKEKLNSIKHHLGVLVRRNKRFVPHEPEYPTKWWPGRVIDPRSGDFFTFPGSWDFIAEKLEEKGTVIEPIPLEKPEGKTGYVLRECTKHGIIYMKIHFGIHDEDVVWGRSFHYEGKG